ncbi:MAG: T9SS type A sorting domain-containing protein [Sphingobacteriia bacterium]|nr:T9SS type A sorting domain-containing protein [Sphingobacteriia bacterium]
MDADAEITVTDAKGQVVGHEVSNSSPEMSIDLSGCNPGVYIIKIEQNIETIFRKIVRK